MKVLTKFSTGSLIIVFLFALFGNFQSLKAIDVGITIIPGSPNNADVVYSVATRAELTWDASTSPVSDIESYTIFYKESATADYPLTPQITRTDSLTSYSEVITVPAGTAYDFIVYANSYDGLTSPEDCESCSVTDSKACGDGLAITGEDCDGTDLAGALCLDVGHNSGAVTCTLTCEFDYSGCSSGGGGTPVDEDTTAPNPGTASSPEYANTSPFTVDYSGAVDTGGSGLNYVVLFAKKGTAGWMNTDLASTTSSGSFDFVPDSSPNANYYFSLQAFDNDGNASAWPIGSGDTSTIYDTEAPAIETIIIPESTNSIPIIVGYENAVDIGISGFDHVELWYRHGEEIEGVDVEWLDSGLTSAASDGSFNFEPTASDYYYFDLIAVDKAGNKSIEDFETQIAVMYDVDPPHLTSVYVDAVSVAPIVIGYEGAIDIGPAGLKIIELWYKKEATGVWTYSELMSTTENGSFDFVPTTIDGNYHFDFVLEDNVGNRSEEVSGDGAVNVIYAAEPFAAELSNLPDLITESGSVDVSVEGDDIVSYKYKINDDEYSNEISVTDNITLTDLSEDIYLLSVIGKHNMDWWQEVDNPTTYSWEVVAPPPPPTALLSNLPDAETELTTASITVGGANVVAYSFKFDLGSYGNEIIAENTIGLSNLSLGEHTLNVIAKSDLGVWQAESTPTTYSWTVIAPPPPPEEEEDDRPIEGPIEEPIDDEEEEEEEEEVADEGEEDVDEEEITPEDVQEVLLGEDLIPHCENSLTDEDEEDINCGGTECPICIDVFFEIMSRPMGRTFGNYESTAALNLFSVLSARKIRTTDISIDNTGDMEFLFEKIPANTYHIGIKSDGYLQKIIRNVDLNMDNQSTILDFTLGGTFLLIGGDVFNDNVLNSFDLAMMLHNYYEIDEHLDLNKDGLVNAADLAMILKDYQLEGDSP